MRLLTLSLVLLVGSTVVVGYGTISPSRADVCFWLIGVELMGVELTDVELTDVELSSVVELIKRLCL